MFEVAEPPGTKCHLKKYKKDANDGLSDIVCQAHLSVRGEAHQKSAVFDAIKSDKQSADQQYHETKVAERADDQLQRDPYGVAGDKLRQHIIQSIQRKETD